MIRDFAEFITTGVVKRQSQDISRSRFLAKESEKAYIFIDSIIKNVGLTDDNANSIVKLCYDTMMELIRAEMLMHGYNAVGQGAHEAEVTYLLNLGFSENDAQFADQLRYFRNRM